jgi:Uma2 family endonuclease
LPEDKELAETEHFSEEAYSDLVFAQRAWSLELYDGRLRDKPPMTWGENGVQTELSFYLMDQLDQRQYHVFTFLRVRLSPGTILVPDVMVVPTRLGEPFRDQWDELAIFDDPLPLVADIVCAANDYDAAGKVANYQQRGDREIWLVAPKQRTLTRWVRQADGSYRESLHRDGIVHLSALPGVEIDLGRLVGG